MNELPRRSFLRSSLAFGCGLAATPLLNPARASEVKTTQAAPSGFFTLGKRNDHWWLITPEGKPFFTMGLNHIDPASLRYPENLDIWREKYGGITEPGSTKPTTNKNANANRLFERIPNHGFDRNLYLVKGTHFKLTCIGEIGEIKRTIEAVINVAGGYEIESWREY